jgi:hypothetical protein
MDDHDPDLTSTRGVLINEPSKPTFLTKSTKYHDMLLILIKFEGLSLTEFIYISDLGNQSITTTFKGTFWIKK